MGMPAHWWKWPLLFSPTPVMLLTTGWDKAFAPRYPDDSAFPGFVGAMRGFYAAFLLCVIAGSFLSKPSPHWAMRVFWTALTTVAVGAVNVPFAFVGCLLVMRL